MLAGLLSSGLTHVLGRSLCRSKRWERNNYAGRTVNLYGGVALASALALSNAINALLDTREVRGTSSTPLFVAGSLSALGAGMAGLVDDMGDLSTIRKSDPPYEVATDNLVAVEHAKGFKGHLGALRQGRVTTGIMKIVAIGGTAACAATVLQALHSSRRRPAVQALGDWVVDSALIAGMANMHNLFDLRPGRALKVGALLSTPGMVSPKIRKLSANTLGAIAVALPNDLNEHTMLGDTGANALGAVVGVQIAAQASRPVKFVVFLSVAALTMISEKVSFSKVIESCRLLKAVDSWGRRPH